MLCGFLSLDVCKALAVCHLRIVEQAPRLYGRSPSTVGAEGRAASELPQEPVEVLRPDLQRKSDANT